MSEISKEMIEAAKNAYWHEVHHGEGYGDKCYEAAISAALISRPGAMEGEDGLVSAKAVWDFVYGEKRGNVSAEDLAAFLSTAPTPLKPELQLYGPYAYLTGHRALNEESWTVESDPIENNEEYFSIPLFAKVEPVYPVSYSETKNQGLRANRAYRVGYAAGFAAARDEAKDEMARAVRTREAAIDYWKAGEAGAALSSPPEPVSVAEGEPDANAMRVIDPDQWEPCSPGWLNRGGDCACAPRVWNAKDGNHWHPKIEAPPERRDAQAECGYGGEFNAIRNFDHDYEIGGDIEPQPAPHPSDGELVRKAEAFDQIVAVRKKFVEATAAYNARLEFVKAERARGNWNIKLDREYEAVSEAQSAYYRTVQELSDRARCQEAGIFWARKAAEAASRCAVPTGYRLVPIEPTPEMIKAGRIPTREIPLPNGTSTTGLALGADPRSIYERMLSASPPPAAESGWRGIDSLPLQQHVLIYRQGIGMHVFIATDRHWREAFEYVDDEPTHWMPLPAPPVPAESEGE